MLLSRLDDASGWSLLFLSACVMARVSASEMTGGVAPKSVEPDRRMSCISSRGSSPGE